MHNVIWIIKLNELHPETPSPPFSLHPGGFSLRQLWSNRGLFTVRERNGNKCNWEDCHCQIWKDIQRQQGRKSLGQNLKVLLGDARSLTTASQTPVILFTTDRTCQNVLCYYNTLWHFKVCFCLLTCFSVYYSLISVWGWSVTICHNIHTN